VYKSLKNSKTRNKAFEYVCSNYSDERGWLSAKQIANKTNYSERSVLGALLGDGTRFKKEDSLVFMGVMKYREADIYGYTIPLFSPTPKGREIFEKSKLKDYAHNTKEAPNCEEQAKKGNEEGITCKE
jgi:predicted transcriptional regulator with HTH domain